MRSVEFAGICIPRCRRFGRAAFLRQDYSEFIPLLQRFGSMQSYLRPTDAEAPSGHTQAGLRPGNVQELHGTL